MVLPKHLRSNKFTSVDKIVALSLQTGRSSFALHIGNLRSKSLESRKFNLYVYKLINYCLVKH